MNRSTHLDWRHVRTVCGALALAALLGSTTGCTSTKNDADTESSTFSDDAAGDEPLAGIVRIASVDRSTLQEDGTVRYVLDNVSAADQENLSASVSFFYPPSADSEIALEFETDVSEDEGVPLFAGQTGLELVATSRAFAARKERGEPITATRINVRVEEVVPMIERTADTPGTRFFNGQLELVEIANEDFGLGLDGAEPQLWFDIANVSRGAIDNLEVKVIVLDTISRTRTSETDWQRVATVAAGSTVRVHIDLSKAGPVRLRDYILKARQSLDIFGF